MIWRLSRILMNQADGSPGGGQAPPPTPQAQGASTAPAAPAIDVNALASALAPTIAAQVKQSQDSVFAALRKAGVLDGEGKKAGGNAGGDGGVVPPPAAATGMTEADVERLVEFRTAIATAGFDQEQTSIVRTLFAVDKPDTSSIATWVAGKAKAMGVKGAATATTTINTAANAVTRGSSATNAGAPAPVPSISEDTPLLRLSTEQVEHLIRTKGEDWVAAKWADEMRTATLKTR